VFYTGGPLGRLLIIIAGEKTEICPADRSLQAKSKINFFTIFSYNEDFTSSAVPPIVFLARKKYVKRQQRTAFKKNVKR
jgi:hypothetical protein